MRSATQNAQLRKGLAVSYGEGVQSSRLAPRPQHDKQQADGDEDANDLGGTDRDWTLASPMATGYSSE